jgi:multisubunit Na+/H+ antiporter MnhE subunit
MSLARKRLAAGLALIGHFAFSSLASGFQTLRIIVSRVNTAEAGFVVYTFAPMSETAATVLASVISLTPGTTVVDIAPSEGRMRLHLLDIARSDATLREIRARLEPLVRALFTPSDHR